MLLPQGIECRRRAVVDVELVAEDDARRDVIAVWVGLDLQSADGRLRRKSEGLSLQHQVAVIRDAPEGNPARADQAGDRLGQVAEERGKLHLGLEISGNGRPPSRGLRV